MVVWLSYAAMAILAFIGPALTQHSRAVMMPGVNSRTSTMGSHMRRRRPQRPPSTAEADNPSQPAGPAIVTPPAEGRAVGKVDGEIMEMDKMSIGTMEEFAKMLGIEMNDDSNGIPALLQDGGNGVLSLNQSMCKEPEERTVKLALEDETNVRYFPSCVKLQRCGGCCGPMLECRPIKTEAIYIKVMRAEIIENSDTGSASSQEEPGSSDTDVSSRRQRRQTTYQMMRVAEEQHIECDCLCKVQEQDCNLDVQEYMRNKCACHCRNRNMEEECKNMPMTHYWDDDQCMCFCNNPINCTVSLSFDHSTCSCVKESENLLPYEGSEAGFVSGNDLYDVSERFRRDRIPVSFGRGRREAREVKSDDNP